MLMLEEIKAHAITAFRLLPACLEGRDYNISSENEEETEYNTSSQLQSARAEEGNKNDILDDARRELQSFLSKNISSKYYNNARHLLSRAFVICDLSN